MCYEKQYSIFTGTINFGANVWRNTLVTEGRAAVTY